MALSAPFVTIASGPLCLGSAALTAGRGFLPVFVLLSILCGCDKRQAAVEELIGTDARKIFRHPSGVESFRVFSPVHHFETSQPALSDNAPMIENCYISVAGPTMDQTFAKELTSVVLDPTTYREEMVTCEFDPGVAFRIRNGDTFGFVNILICFHCGQLQVTTHDKSGIRLHGAIRDFDAPASAKLIRLVQRVFPNDPQIQSLAK